MNIKTIVTALALGLGASTTLLAQEETPERRPPAPPIMAALDANKDGVIDANEIANASAALATLDKNGDGQLTREELRPAGRGPGRPGGPGPDGTRGERSRGPRN